MKKNIALLLTALCLLLLGYPTEAADSAEKRDASRRSADKILIAYFTTNRNVDTSQIDPNIDATSQASVVIPNMELVAKYIHNTIGGTLFSIETEKVYPVGAEALNAMGYEELEANARPALKTHVKNMADYDIIFLTYPNWCGTFPMAIATFLEEYDFSGKKLILSCTSFGSGFGSSVRDVENLCPEATVIRGYLGSGRNTRQAEQEVAARLKELDF
jgi:flavodoxin